MGDAVTVDARGLSCPQPALMVHEAIRETGKGTIEVLVDSGTARDNVSRLARNSGWTVKVDELPGHVRLVLTK